MITQAPPYPNALKVLMKNAGFSYQELAKEVGIGERTLYDWAAGKRVIPRTEREKLAYFIGCAVQDLAPGITSLRLVQLSHERADEHQQGIDDDMNQTRRLLLRLLGAGVAFLVVCRIIFPF